MVRHMIYGAVEHAVWRFVFRGGRLGRGPLRSAEHA